MEALMESVARFQKLLESKGLKYTFERKTIVAKVMRMNEHFDADGLYAYLKKSGLRIARDTVYRTLPLLLESRVVQKSAGTGKREFFERIGRKGHHDHIQCTECGKIIEFQCEEIEKLQKKVCERYKFQLAFHDHRLFGVCHQCHRSHL